MKKQKTIGSNPLDAYLQNTKAIKQSEKNSAIKEPKNNPEQKPKQRITIHLTIELIEQIKNAVFWEPGMTLTSFAQEALEIALKKLEKNRGQSYPLRKNNHLKGGRPLS